MRALILTGLCVIVAFIFISGKLPVLMLLLLCTLLPVLSSFYEDNGKPKAPDITEETCRILADTIHVYIFQFTPEGIVTYMNKYAEEISGYSKEEIIGRNFIEIFVPNYFREKLIADLVPVIAGETITKDYEAPMITKNGEVLTMLWSGARMVAPDGHVIGIVGSGINITDLKRAQEELHESREQYRALVDYSPDAIIVVGKEDLLLANRKMEDLSGYTAEELQSMNLLDIIHPDDKQYAIDSIDSVMKNGENVRQPMEFRLITKSGRTRIVEGRGVKITYNGKPAILGTIIDVTEQKHLQEALRQSERMYRTLVDHSVAGVFIIQDAKFVYANKRAEEISGYTLDEAKDMFFWEVIYPEDRPDTINKATKRLKGEQVEERYELRMITKSNEVRTVEIWATPIEYHSSPAILVTMIDVTERRQREEDRLNAERELEQHKRQLYREAIAALTNGKLDILEPNELTQVLKKPRLTVEIYEAKDVSLARHMVKDLAVRSGLTNSRLDDFILAVGEATMNSMKHAGSGIVFAGLENGFVWVAVSDKGTGMDTFVLTRAVLSRGFSTKPSLGFGYTFILNGSDHVFLATSPKGTTVVMNKSIAPPKEVFPVDLSRIPDLW